LIHNFTTFVGQSGAKTELLDRVAAKQVDEPMPHLLLTAPPEMGKATFAQAIATELGVEIHSTVADEMKKGLDLSGVLMHVSKNEVLLIEDIDLLRGEAAKLLLQFLSEGWMSIWIGTGPGSRQHAVDLAPFTVIATTSRPWQLAPALRRWFVSVAFGPYGPNEIAEVLTRLASLEGLEVERAAAELLAVHCRGTPGNASALLRRIKTHYRSMAAGGITAEIGQRLVHLLGYDTTDAANVALADRLRAMSGVEFEHFIAEMFRQRGYSVELTASSGDHGIDVLLKKEGRTGAVQCKRWIGAVGEPVVRDFLGAMIGAGVTEGFITTTSTFTDQAWSFAGSHSIKLLDLDSLVGMSGE
jgi:Holliday junction resolvasome RuvABC ATP-dependent DNA helicase subunit